MGDEAKENLGQINGIPINGDVAEKGEPKMVIAAQCWFSDLQALEKFTRHKDPPLQPVRPNQVAMSRYWLIDVYKGGFGSGLFMTKEISGGIKDGPGRVHARHGIWCEDHQCKSSNNR